MGCKLGVWPWASMADSMLLQAVNSGPLESECDLERETIWEVSYCSTAAPDLNDPANGCQAEGCSQVGGCTRVSTLAMTKAHHDLPPW